MLIIDKIYRDICLPCCLFIVAAFMGAGVAEGRNLSLKEELMSYVRSCKAHIGIALITDANDTVCVNDGYRYPMNSVMKLYQAMAVADKLQKGGIPLDSMLSVSMKDLHAETYSPMHDEHADGDFHISLADVLRYSLQQSDNNACDILFDRITGISETDAYIRGLGLDGFAIRVDEKGMFANHDLSANNWNTPLTAAILINKLFTEKLFLPLYNDFLIETLNACSTGQNRLAKPLLKTGATIGHKTGTGFMSPDGFPQGINDVGFVKLPDGRHYAIAVFIESSCCDMDGTERMIADISSIVLKFMQGK